MHSSSTLLVVVAFVYLTTICDLTTASIKFYGGTNKGPFDVFYIESMDYDCRQISDVRKIDQFPTKFVITETCIVVYETPDCSTSGWIIKVTPPGFNFDKQPNSFRKCKADEDAHQLDVYLVSHNTSTSDTQEVVETYRHVCSCENIPEYVQEMEKWSINNYGCKVVAYFEPNCLDKEWDSMTLKQGIHTISRQFPAPMPTEIGKATINMIKSFGPDPNSTYFKTRCISPETFAHVFDKRLQIVEILTTMENKLEIISQTTGQESKENSNILEKVCLLKQMIYPLEHNDTHSKT